MIMDRILIYETQSRTTPFSDDRTLAPVGSSNDRDRVDRIHYPNHTFAPPDATSSDGSIRD